MSRGAEVFEFTRIIRPSCSQVQYLLTRFLHRYSSAGTSFLRAAVSLRRAAAFGLPVARRSSRVAERLPLPASDFLEALGSAGALMTGGRIGSGWSGKTSLETCRTSASSTDGPSLSEGRGTATPNTVRTSYLIVFIRLMVLLFLLDSTYTQFYVCCVN